MNDMAENMCVEPLRTVKDLMCDNYQLLSELYSRLLSISFNLSGNEQTEIPTQNPKGLTDALKEQGDRLKCCNGLASEILNILG